MICVCKVFRYTAKELDEACTIAGVSCVRLYYYGARYLDAKYSRWMSADPAAGEYIPMAPVNDEARKHNESLPGQGGVFNVVNFQLYHYAGSDPVKYTDPDGKIILNIIEKFNMSIKPLRDINLGNSRSKTFGQTGCYVTTFANIFVSSKYYGLPLANADKYDTLIKINNKDLFLKDSDWIKGRDVSMDNAYNINNLKEIRVILLED